MREDSYLWYNVEYQLVNREEMLEFGNHHFSVSSVSTGSGGSHQWMVNRV